MYLALQTPNTPHSKSLSQDEESGRNCTRAAARECVDTHGQMTGNEPEAETTHR